MCVASRLYMMLVGVQLVPQFAGQEKKIEIHLSSGQVSLLFSLSNF